MQFIMFNVTNAEAVIASGEKPRLEEVGPFSYRYVPPGIQARFYRTESWLGSTFSTGHVYGWVVEVRRRGDRLE